MPARSANRSAAAQQASSALLAEAQPLLALATELRATSAIHDVEQVRAAIQRQLRDFEIRALARGIASARLVLAKTALSALIDDAVQAMPWGATAGALAGGLAVPSSSLAALRPAGVPAETAAQRLLAASRGGATDMALQELLRVILALGFDARALPAGAPGSAELAALRARLEAAPARSGVQADTPLSMQWAPAVRRGSALVSWLPLWAAGLLLAAALAVTAFALLLALGRQSDRVYARLAALRPAAVARAAPSAAPRLAQPLAGDIAERRLAVRDENDRSVVIVPDQVLFEPGLATLRPGATGLLRRVAAVLAQARGALRVIDHTDGNFERSARFPSDWDLSVERARVVRDALAQLGVDEARLQFDGRADTEPLAPGAAGAALAGNGRVEVELLAGR